MTMTEYSIYDLFVSNVNINCFDLRNHHIVEIMNNEMIDIAIKTWEPKRLVMVNEITPTWIGNVNG